MADARDVPFMFEIGTLRHVSRTWRQFGGLDMSNVAEHSFRVAWIASVLAMRENADVGRCVQLALLHDVPETRTGDVNYIHRIHTVRNEDSALVDAIDGTTGQEHWLALWAEWTARETLEAKIVYDADNLDCDYELSEQADRGARLPGKLAPTRTAVRARLQTGAARDMFDAIQRADPHGWHLETRNRLTVGDWSEQKPAAPPVHSAATT